MPMVTFLRVALHARATSEALRRTHKMISVTLQDVICDRECFPEKLYTVDAWFQSLYLHGSCMFTATEQWIPTTALCMCGKLLRQEDVLQPSLAHSEGRILKLASRHQAGDLVSMYCTRYGNISCHLNEAGPTAFAGGLVFFPSEMVLNVFADKVSRNPIA